MTCTYRTHLSAGCRGGLKSVGCRSCPGSSSCGMSAVSPACGMTSCVASACDVSRVQHEVPEGCHERIQGMAGGVALMWHVSTVQLKFLRDVTGVSRSWDVEAF